MSLQIHTPSPALRPSVTMMWYWEGYHPTHTHERILPFGSMELTFNLTDEPMCFAYPEEGYRPHCLHGAIVSGVHSRFFVTAWRLWEKRQTASQGLWTGCCRFWSGW